MAGNHQAGHCHAFVKGSVAFSRLDLRKAYHQLVERVQPLHHHIQHTCRATSIQTIEFRHIKRQRNFSTYDLESLHGIPGVKNISDDIIVYGASQEAHDANLRKAISTFARKRAHFKQS